VQEKFDQPAKGYVSTKVKIELLALCKFTILILQHANKEQKIIIETARFIQIPLTARLILLYHIKDLNRFSVNYKTYFYR
jgi:hypothetical protein